MSSATTGAWVRDGRCWLPASGRAARAFHDAALRVPRSRREWILGAALGRLPVSGSARGDGPPGLDAPALRERIEATLQSAGVGAAALELVVMEDYDKYARSQCVVFAIDAASGRALAVAKVASDPAHAARLQREGETLRRLRADLPPDVAAALPEALGAFRSGDSTVVVQAARSGRSLYWHLRRDPWPRRLVADHFERALDWLGELWRATVRTEVAVDEETLATRALRPLEDVARRRDAPDGVRAAVDRVRERVRALARDLAGERFPLVARHGDYWARNLLLGPDGLGVVDWEHFEEEGAPFSDALMFATAHGLSYPRALGAWADPVAAFRRTFFDRGWLSRLVRERLATSCRALGVTPRLLDLFFPAFLAECVLTEIARSRDGAPSKGVSRWQRLLQEHARADASVFSG